jgi:GntR family transcriptional regulator
MTERDKASVRGLLRESSTALYEQIAANLTNEIAAARYRPFDRLPSESALMKAYGVSRVTVRQALRRLANEGLVFSRRGKGVFVAGSLVEQELSALRGFYDGLIEQGHSPRTELIEFSRERSAMGSQELQAFAVDLYRLKRLYTMGELPFALAVVSLPSLSRSVSRNDAERYPVYSLLKNILGCEVSRATVQIRAGGAEAHEASHMQLDPGAPVLYMERTSFDSKGLVLEITKFCIRSDVFAFQLEVNGPLQIGSSIRRV